ncbi:hypothetical protein D3C85_1260060 [compost metagenome]
MTSNGLVMTLFFVETVNTIAIPFRAIRSKMATGLRLMAYGLCLSMAPSMADNEFIRWSMLLILTITLLSRFLPYFVKVGG